MTVSELIEKLKEMDQNAVVKVWQEVDSSGGWSDVEVVSFESYGEKGPTFACIEC